MVALVAASPLSVVASDNSSNQAPEFDFEMELTASDRDAITLEVMSRYPILAASPGIKFASASRMYASGSRMHPSGETAHVIFYPHSEVRGVKHALQVHCNRSESTEDWSCPIVEERRYVKLDTQDFEVRVV